MLLDIGQVVVTIESKYALVEVCELDGRYYRMLLLRSSDGGEIIGHDMARLLDDEGVPLVSEQIPDELKREYPGFIVTDSSHPGLIEGEVFPVENDTNNRCGPVRLEPESRNTKE